MEVLPAASQDEEATLLAMAENWSPSEVEEKASFLLESARKVLLATGSSHEVKLDCFRWMAERLVVFVPVFELEDTLLYPLLGAVFEYLEEVLSMLVETVEENKVVFLSLACTLVEHTEKVVRHCLEQKECGVGELPSLPRMLPKILITTFSYLNRGEIIATTDQLKAELANCFSKARNLLVIFLTLVEEIKIRTVLEDELDILVNLCSELVTFHQVLIPLDFKLTCMVWRVYVKLTSTHKVKLVDRLDHTLAIEVISGELCDQVAILRLHMLEDSKDNGTAKVMTKIVYLQKLLISFGSSPVTVGECPSFLRFLLEIVSGLSCLPTGIPQPSRQKMVEEVMSATVKHNLLTMAATESFTNFLFKFFSPDHPVKQLLNTKPFLSLQLVVELLLLQPGQEDQLLLLCLHLLSSSGFCMEQGQTLEGRQIMGKSIITVDNYTYLLTNICCWVSSITPTMFPKVEKVLISTLLDPSSSPMTCMIVADIWCFLARYGTSQLCLAYLTLLSSIKKKLKQNTFSIPLFMMDILTARLTNFLSPTDLSTWQSRAEVKPDLEELQSLSSAAATRCLLLGARNNDDKLSVVVKDTWRKLVEGAYRPADRMSSLRLIMSLTRATSVVVDRFSTDDLICLLEQMGTVARVGQWKQYLLLCLVKVMRVAARTMEVKKDEKISEFLNVVGSRCNVSCLGVLVNMALGEVEVGAQHDKWIVQQGEELEQTEIEELLGVVWSAEEGERMHKVVNCLDGDEVEVIMRKVSPTPQGRLSPKNKKRKLTPSKMCLEQCLVSLEREVDSLTDMVIEERKEMIAKREWLERVANKLESVLKDL